MKDSLILLVKKTILSIFFIQSAIFNKYIDIHLLKGLINDHININRY